MNILLTVGVTLITLFLILKGGDIFQPIFALVSLILSVIFIMLSSPIILGIIIYMMIKGGP